jgi:hypothetical protein
MIGIDYSHGRWVKVHRADESALALRLSANVGCYQTALCDGDREAARAFLANVLAIGELLLGRGP